MANKKTTSNFLIQGSILAFAGILVRIIGLVYRIPLNNILGDEGKGYYATAYSIYAIILLLSSQSMPLAVSKLVSAQIAKNEHRNAKKYFIGSLIYALVVGGFFGITTYFGADLLAKLYGFPAASRALKILAPTIFIVSIIGVFRGYFQGMGQMAPTAISQVVEQIVNAIVSVFAAYKLYGYGLEMNNYSETTSNTNAASYSAAGGTLGTCLGAFAAFVVLLFIFMKMRSTIKDNIKNSSSAKEESYKDIIKLLIMTITPVLLSTAIYNIGDSLDNAIYGNINGHILGISSSKISSLWGIYSGNYLLLTTMPIAISSAMSLSIVPAIVRSFEENDINMVKNKINIAIRFTMIIAFPCGMGLSVLGNPINTLLFPTSGHDDVTSKLMIFSVISVVGFSLSTITNSILQGINKLKVPIINSGISLIIRLILLPVLMLVFKLDVYAVAIANFTFALIVCVLNARAIRNEIDYKQEIKITFIKPLISSLVMGLISFVLYYIANKCFISAGFGLVISNDISVAMAILIAVIVYFVTLIKIKGIDKEIIISFPKGSIILKLCRKLHLL